MLGLGRQNCLKYAYLPWHPPNSYARLDMGELDAGGGHLGPVDLALLS
jgi:hypothetical protein